MQPWQKYYRFTGSPSKNGLFQHKKSFYTFTGWDESPQKKGFLIQHKKKRKFPSSQRHLHTAAYNRQLARSYTGINGTVYIKNLFAIL